MGLPVVSIDNSFTKLLETNYGTGQAIVQALKIKFSIELENSHVVVFGYGKVGSGIVKALKSAEANVIVLDICDKAIMAAQKSGFKAFNLKNISEVISALSNANGVITATGHKNMLSSTFTQQQLDTLFSKKMWLANGGADNEYGPYFDLNKLLGEGVALNFLLDSPTPPKFLDPVFALSNLIIGLIQNGKIENGLQKVPKKYDRITLHEWKRLHPLIDISDIFTQLEKENILSNPII